MKSARELILLVVLIIASAARPAHAQFPSQPRPHLDWQSASTEHFVFHYPKEMEAWSLDVAARMEAVQEAVSRYVGFTPERPVHVIVDNPTNSSNGSAYPILDAPAILLWPTPPGPTSVIGHSRGWGEMLAVHEYAHVAHLTRPTRNPLRRLLYSLLPITPGQVALSSPRWVFEGYATVVEGAITGSGRPYGVMRPAILRQRALEGRLPSYWQLDTDESYAGGGMAYLAGSAYLEWLAGRSSDSALVHLWRRMSARRPRTFAESFAGVFGDSPQALYGRFSAEVTANAVAVEDTLRAAGLVTGDTILALEYGTGSPSVSPDDSLIAAVVRFRNQPPRLVVWRTTVDTAALTRIERERERIQRADPLDVPAVRSGPPPRRQVAELSPAVGTRFEAPQFLPDGRRLLVWRSEPLGDGAWRGDLHLWNLADGSTRRVTQGAAVHDAAPLNRSDGAVAVRCAAGVCDLVEIDLSSGDVHVLAPGSFDSPWAHPTPSPDDRWIAASRSIGGIWEIVLVERIVQADGISRAGRLHRVETADGASRYQPVWLAGGPLAPGLIVVSEAGGIANLELVPLSADMTAGERRTITRVTGGVLAPTVPRDGSAVYFLSLHSGGLDLQRLALADSTDPDEHNEVLARAMPLVHLSPERAAVAPQVPLAADSFPRGPVRTIGSYGVGPRRHAVWPLGGGGAAGGYGGLALASSDPVGRLTWVLQGVYGERELWRGGAFAAAWRGMRPSITGTVFYGEQRPSQQSRLQPAGLDVDYLGATLVAELPRDGNGWTSGLRAGASAGRLSAPGAPDDANRTLGFAEARARMVFRSGRSSLAIGASIHGSAGRTGEASWQRALGSLSIAVSPGEMLLLASLTGGVTGGDDAGYERFIVGGIENPFVDNAVLSQRVSHPALPLGMTSGSDVVVWRVATRYAGGELFLWNASARGWRNEQHRLVGYERSIAALRLPIVNVPGVQVHGGIAYSIDAPFRREARLYGGIGIVP